MRIPQCYDAIKQFDARDRAETRMAAHRPRCQCCGDAIRTETMLDLQPFGVNALACQRCVDRHIRWNDDTVS